MPFARHTLSRSLLAIAMLAALAACKQTAPPTTTSSEDTAKDAAAAVSDEAIAVAAAANAAPATSPVAPTAPTPLEVKPVVADKAAKDAVIAAMDKFRSLRRYRITMMRGDGQASPTTTTVDYVAPDRYRVTTTGSPTRVVIGDTLYTTDASGTRKTAAPADAAQWGDPVGFLAAGQDFTAEAGPRRFVFAMPASEYKLHVTRPVASNMNVWIGPEGLPIKLESQGLVGGKLFTTAIRYSHFDSAEVKIDAPK